MLNHSAHRLVHHPVSRDRLTEARGQATGSFYFSMMSLVANLNVAVVFLQEYSPMLGQAGSRDRVNQEGKRVAALKDLWQAKVPMASTLGLLHRVLRLLFHLVQRIVEDKAVFQTRTHLFNSVQTVSGNNANCIVSA